MFITTIQFAQEIEFRHLHTLHLTIESMISTVERVVSILALAGTHSMNRRLIGNSQAYRIGIDGKLSFRRVMSNLLIGLGIVVSGISPSEVHAETLQVSNAALIQYAVTSYDGKVYLRNLDTFSSDWHGCCGYYWLDLSTPAGQAQFSSLLTAAASNGAISLYIASASAGGQIVQVGRM